MVTFRKSLSSPIILIDSRPITVLMLSSLLKLSRSSSRSLQLSEAGESCEKLIRSSTSPAVFACPFSPPRREDGEAISPRDRSLEPRKYDLRARRYAAVLISSWSKSNSVSLSAELESLNRILSWETSESETERAITSILSTLFCCGLC
jgi:hypothetical protein